MQLKVRRSQNTGGMMGGKVIFALDARAELTSEEAANVKKYGLGKQVVYNSEAAKKYLDKTAYALGAGGAGGLLKGVVNLAMAKLSLNITVDSLTKGQHIECKSLDELLGAEEAVSEACKNIKTYLDTAATFDGREVVIEF